MAAATYDIEKLLGDIQALLVANLNTKIASINTEKNDSITLKTVDSSAYFLQELNGKQVNNNPFVLYGLESIATQSLKGHSLQEVTVSVVIVVVDQGEDVSIANRMLRYQRALKEVFEDNFQLIENGSILKIQSLMPVAFESLNSSESYRVVGVNLKSALG